MIADVRAETFLAISDACANGAERVIDLHGILRKENKPLADMLFGPLFSLKEGPTAVAMGAIMAFTAVMRTESAKELQRHLVAGADTEQDRADGDTADSPAQRTAHQGKAPE